MIHGLVKLSDRQTIPGEPGIEPAQRNMQRSAMGVDATNGISHVDDDGPARRQQVETIAARINDTLRQMKERFSVTVDDASGMLVVIITDSVTGELIKQIPPQQILDANVSVKQIVGLLFDAQA